ncbi:biotin-dependent carboxyltransferase family protein [Metabacillus fastidiosus]|uniref:5-oxoprolinase subunit C family protein n=1 Tax=Metabacillus fastidiosus TaxID=1458 RepID=UPI000824872F|nr:biotin-dependent carboxyltransferase family protein [Metabacillus fastidiosus]MED4463633.1 biotin-dependent carboxyltransferase family protein [Metabacillus fastidiosus]
MSIHILKPGLLTTVQDMGRYGFQKYGVVVSGAMDSVAARLANIVVGNDEREALLELTLTGPTISFSKDAVISICGADFSPQINGEKLPMWRPVLIHGQSVLQFSNVKEGCRAYIAVAGGIDIPLVMGSRSTYIRAQIGGFKGRALKREDVLQIKEPSGFSARLTEKLRQVNSSPFSAANWTPHYNWRKLYSKNNPIRFIRGPQYELFSNKVLNEHYFQISPQSDRMGYRLTGHILSPIEKTELFSEAVPIGTIQVPPDGNPIILMADRQTTGGYPILGIVASVDIPVLAQMKPGDKLKLKEITLEDAEKELIERETALQLLKQTIKLAIGEM